MQRNHDNLYKIEVLNSGVYLHSTIPGRPLARLRRFAAEQEEVTWSSRVVWSKSDETQWVEETEPALVLMPVQPGFGGMRQHHW
jgi:hypothetical protein